MSAGTGGESPRLPGDAMKILIAVLLAAATIAATPYRTRYAGPVGCDPGSSAWAP